MRVVTFNAFASAYQLVHGWARRAGHELVLLVTPESVDDRYGSGPTLRDQIPATQEILATNKLRTVAAPAIEELAPDLVVSVTFPLRIPVEVTRIPKFGALNVHPSPLPLGRGPNPQRTIYEGERLLGATAHRIAPEFDAGEILAQRTRPWRDGATTDDVLRAWYEMVAEVLAEGAARAAAGEQGAPQDEGVATYAGKFTDEERWLSFAEPANVVQRKAVALNLLAATARIRLPDGEFLADDVRASGEPTDAAPGTVVARSGDRVAVASSDGVVELTIHPAGWTSAER